MFWKKINILLKNIFSCQEVHFDEKINHFEGTLHLGISLDFDQV